MRPFSYDRATDVKSALTLGKETGSGQTAATVQYLAGGTTLVDLMKLDVLRPQRLVDLNPLRKTYNKIDVTADGLVIGAFVTMADAANNRDIIKNYPAISQSLQLAASAQLRNMATLGGNVLQKTRCSYYRDATIAMCNKRLPGSGCAAISGTNRNHAVLGVSENCISQYPSDFGIALAALDAEVIISGDKGVRTVPFSTLHRAAYTSPHIENNLLPGEIITNFKIPQAKFNQRSTYVKVRDRASYEFAIASAAVALELEGEVVRQCRVALGGSAYKPWRSSPAEQSLIGKRLDADSADAAARAAMQGAVTHGQNDYKPELVARTLVRALLQAKALEI